MAKAPRDATPLMYRLARGLGGVILGVYFRKIETQGQERLAAPGPALFAANHPQSITDALVLGLGAGRMVHFVAHSGLFRRPVRAAILRGAGVVPVFRPHDTEGAAEKNVEMFRACREVLERGGAIGIFPEGTSRDELRVERLKTGTARIALEAEAAHDFRLGVRVVPVGIHFETPRRFRSRVLLRAGVPLLPGTYADRYREDPRRAVEEFTALLHAALADQVVHLEHPELGSLVLDIEAVYREELLTRPEIPLPGGSRFTRQAILAGEIAKAVSHFETHDPGALRALAGDLALYGSQRAKLGVPEALLRPGALPSARREAARSVLPLLLGLPLAAWGLVWCGLPYRLTGWVLARRKPDLSKIHWTRLWVGLLVYGFYYPLLLALAVVLLGPWPAAVFGASLLPAGLFAMAYGRFWQRRRNVIRLGWLAAARHDAVEEVRDHRRRLLAVMDRMLAEYLGRRGLLPGIDPGGSP